MIEQIADQVARDGTAQALSIITGHIQVCAERQRHIDGRMDTAQQQRDRLEARVADLQTEMNTLIRGIRRDIWNGMIYFNIGLLGIVGFLVVRVFFK